ncbi:MAG: hypothetical protein EPN97_15510 [Alphaproteobacteria bacterium]|nr:MAG: hypothetical protein EPN97_15510 [Alphaproteobacteria bacterium]
MKYVLPVILSLVIAGVAPARAELRIYGPHLYGQIEQARQAAIMERALAKRQKTQAEQAALYAHELEKRQKTQAAQSAIDEKELAKRQKKQAELAGAYMLELGKGQKKQAELAAEYAKVLAAHDLQWRNARYALRAEQEKEMTRRGGKMFDESLLNEPVAVKEPPKKSDGGANLLDALKSIDSGADFR